MAGYGSWACCRALGFILFFLLSPAVGGEFYNLKNIVDYLQSTYGDSNGSQYALGINVQVQYCTPKAKLDQNFLSQDVAHIVKRAMNSECRIYEGQQLVGAKPKPIQNTGNNIHSEYLLLRYFDPSPMQDLLNKPGGGCTVFYTYNSPCVKTCSTPTGQHSIIPGLNIFTNHQGPKAFVFNQIWHLDYKNQTLLNQWKQNILVIEQRIPVYRCNNRRCVRCVRDGTTVHSFCLGRNNNHY